ncbi:MAG: NAD(P)H-hydrate dehydratase [Luteolibacter sp.]|uniref:NAD(P)H-hydrate dehydratase n=1 Tax=Luteolibacter sp. TaxID=1962973 RepID=UPI003265DDF4
MGAVTIAEALAIEVSALANGWTEEQLLNAAGEKLGHAVARFFPTPGTIIGYLGKGHNAGDALVALRILRDQYGWEVATRNAYPIGSYAPLTLLKWDELGLVVPLDRRPAWRDIKRPLVLLDGLLGSGSSGSLREPLVSLASEIENLRQQSGARVAAVDFPSGIDPDCGQVFPDTVSADVTFMIGNAKSGLLNGHAAHATGALALVAVEPLTARNPSDLDLISPQTLDVGKSPRPFDFHKGMAGRVAIVAGSENYTGAAVLAACGALRGGAGLVTLFVPEAIHHLVSGKCPPEVIVRSYENPSQVLDSRFDSLVVGCGLGEMDSDLSHGLLVLLSNSPAPVVIDADALNFFARSGHLNVLTSQHVITPHPGEFARLAPDLADLPREDAARQFADRTPATLLLKGCRTIVTRQGQPLRCNATGTPGMASGGQGDVLAGVIGARLAIGDSPMDAASMAAWLCGRSAEIALTERHLSEESLLATDVLHFLGAAFRDWKTSSR